jgi:two-component system phosphate regulon sensor histidine kinase PhoR
VRINLFWKLGLTYLALLVVVLAAVDFYAVRALRTDYIRAGFEQLESLMRLVEDEPLPVGDAAALGGWAARLKRTGARATLVAADGVVLADSHEDPAQMENHAGRPEIRAAFESGEGRAVRFSTTVGREMVNLARRREPPGQPPYVLRIGWPLAEIDQAVARIRVRLVLASLVILLLAGGLSFLFSRGFSARVAGMKEFSRRVADGDFRPMAVERAGDELSDLGRALNETAARLDATIASLTEERNRSAAILRSMVEGVAVIDTEQRILFCNHAFCRAMAADEAGCQGRRLVEVARQPELLGVAQRVLGTRERVDAEVATPAADAAGQQRSYAVTAAPVAGGDAAGAVVVLHDITELRRLERVRRDFVANVSHEFKTPLTAIQGFAETLLGGALDDAQNARRFLEIIRDHAQRLGRLTDDLLKLSQIEAGTLELELRAVGVAGLVEGCVETTRLKAAPKRMALEVACPADLPAVRADAIRLREVLQNLLDNAVQYTPAGGRVEVRAAATTAGGRAMVTFTVADTGIGIPSAEQSRIFERFYRVDTARSREVGGTGLGLAIAKHIVEAHGGRIWVESAVGAGSRFHFSIPAA